MEILGLIGFLLVAGAVWIDIRDGAFRLYRKRLKPCFLWWNKR